VSERRRALQAKFRATAAERIRRMTLHLLEMEEGRGTEGEAQDVAREMHTLKGESNMLGLAAIGALAHAAETALGVGKSGPPRPEAAALARGALAAVERALGEEPLGADPGGALAAALAELRAFTPAPAEPAPAEPAPTPLPAAASKSAPVEATSESRGAAAAERWVQIGAGRVDGLCEHVDGFGDDFRALSRRLGVLFRAAAAPGDRSALLASIRLAAEDLDRCRSRLDDLHDAAWALRLSPVDPLLADLARHAREIARAQGKRLRVMTRTGGAALPRSLLDELWDPLFHVVQNAVDHGVETPAERGQKPPEASLSIGAESAGGSVVLSVIDDGRGLDPAHLRAAAVQKGLLGEADSAALRDEQALELIFAHGFSTRDAVSEISGRGVGLGLVRSRVEALGGSVAVSGRRGEGARFSLTVPATISRERALVVEVGRALYGIPFRSISELVRAADLDDDEPGERHRSGRPRGSLTAALDAPAPGGERWAVVLDTPRGPFTLTIPPVVGEFDLVRHPLDPLLASLGYLGASAVLDDGRLVLILSVPGLLRRAEGRPLRAEQAVASRPRVLVVEDAPVVRAMLADVLADAGFEVETAGDGADALASIERAEPHLVVSDMDMPRLDGMSLLRAVRGRARRLPFVLLTGRASSEDRARAAAEGADAYLTKSGFAAEALLAAVRRLLPV
jgi:two-component system chemotaxis sensor kinase CheA/two-component system sensor histidine kinase and response regulator WspE